MYLCLVTNDTTKIFQLFRTGFTVWIDPQNSEDKIGIQYPVNSFEEGEFVPTRNEGNGMRNKSDFNKRFSEIKNSQNEVRVLNDDNFPLTIYNTNDTSIIHVDIGMQMGLLVYELQISLTQKIAGKHSLNLKPGDELSLGFESGEIDRENFKNGGFNMGNRPPDDGIGDMGERGNRMPPGGGRFGQKPNGFEKIDFEIAVKLAKEN